MAQQPWILIACLGLWAGCNDDDEIEELAGTIPLVNDIGHPFVGPAERSTARRPVGDGQLRGRYSMFRARTALSTRLDASVCRRDAFSKK